MTIMLGVMIGLIVMIIRVRSALISFRDGFAGKVIGILREKNMKVASALGLTLAHYFMNTMKKNFAEKARSRENNS